MENGNRMANIMHRFVSVPNEPSPNAPIFRKCTESWYKNVWIPTHGGIPKRNTADGHLQPVLNVVNEDIRSGKNYEGATAFKEHVDNSIAAVHPDAENSIHMFSDPFFSKLFLSDCLPCLNIPGAWLFYDSMSGVPKTEYESLVNGGAIGRTGRSNTSIGMYSLGIKDFYESFFYMTVTLTRHADNDGGFTCIVRSNVRQRSSSRLRYSVNGEHAFAEDETRDAFRQTLIDCTPLKEADLSTIMNCIYPDGKTGTLCLAFGMDPNHLWDKDAMCNYYANAYYSKPIENFKMFIDEEEIPIQYKESLGTTVFSHACTAFRTNGLIPTGEKGHKCSDVIEITHNDKPLQFRVEIQRYNTPQYETSKDNAKGKPVSVRIVLKGLHVIDVPIKQFSNQLRNNGINIEFLVDTLKKKRASKPFFDKAQQCTHRFEGNKVFCSQRLRTFAKFGLYVRLVWFIDNPELLMLNKLMLNMSKYRFEWFTVMNTGMYHAWPHLNELSHSLGDSNAFSYLWCPSVKYRGNMQDAGEIRKLSYEQCTPWSSKEETPEELPGQEDIVTSSDNSRELTDGVAVQGGHLAGNLAAQVRDATTDGHVATTDGHVATTDGHVATTDGHVATIDGHVATIDGHVATTGVRSPKRTREQVQRDSGEDGCHRSPKRNKPSCGKKSSDGKKSSGDNRRDFRKSQKDSAWDYQDGFCDNPHCRVVLSRRATDVDHKDGNSSNNSDENCHYLCLLCHNAKSRIETWCKTHQADFEYSMMESDEVWCSRHVSDIMMLMESCVELTEEQRNRRKELIVQWYNGLSNN